MTEARKGADRLSAYLRGVRRHVGDMGLQARTHRDAEMIKTGSLNAWLMAIFVISFVLRGEALRACSNVAGFRFNDVPPYAHMAKQDYVSFRKSRTCIHRMFDGVLRETMAEGSVGAIYRQHMGTGFAEMNPS